MSRLEREPRLLPWPKQVDAGAGSLLLAGSGLAAEFGARSSERMSAAVKTLTERLASRTARGPRIEPTILRIDCESLGGRYPGLEEDESYWLVVDDAGVFVDASCEWGVLRALTTLFQLVRPSGEVPFVAIDDRPRFPWRGLLLDPARHFLNVESIKRTLRGMALCKLNVLHLHLSDDQGFRFPSRAFEKLASHPSYSPTELAEIVELAAELGIRVVPELDMPGHVTSWLTAYPDWGLAPVEASRRFGVHKACLDPSSEEVYQAIGTLLDELAEIFPDPCVHVGGDEVHPAWWSGSPGIAEFMKSEGIADVKTLQARFNSRVAALVVERHKQIVGWDEVIHPSLGDEWIVQCWRGATPRDRAVSRGNRVVVSAPYYLDLNYPAGMHYSFDPAADQASLLALEDSMLEDARLDHVADGMRWTHQWRNEAVELDSTRVEQVVLGGEACLWGELVDAEVLDVRLWSRLPAVAERLWSEASCRDEDDLYRRLSWYLSEIHACEGADILTVSRGKLQDLGITRFWMSLTDMIEPVKWYGRLLGEVALAARISGAEMPQARPYDVGTPLNRVVDHLPPESFAARRVDELVSAVAESPEPAGAELRNLVKVWLALREQANEAPGELSGLIDPLASLGEFIAARLDEGATITATQLDDVVRPRGELMVAVGSVTRSWLTESS